MLLQIEKELCLKGTGDEGETQRTGDVYTCLEHTDRFFQTERVKTINAICEV